MTAIKLDDETADCFYDIYAMLSGACDEQRLDGMPPAEIDRWCAQRVRLLDAIHPGFAAYWGSTEPESTGTAVDEVYDFETKGR